MISITLLGGGNVATHLADLFLQTAGIKLHQIYNRTLSSIEIFKNRTSTTDSFENLIDSDIYIICVSDNAIKKIADKLSNKNGLIVHTSGSMDLEALGNQKRKGVFYPLQSFTKNKEVDFQSIPICLEASNTEDEILLNNLAKNISNNIYKIDSSQRKSLHVAAVFVNNFVNHLYKIGEDICQKNNIPFEILHPLILETATKLNTLTPKQAQTGPAVRNDKETIKIHQAALNLEHKEIYQLLTKAILKT
ncbi:Rossmann-like and DUF2520 domain-containing protein [Bacteroidota bacterium]